MAAARVFAAGKTALITGGASGVGLATTKLCIRHGMKVAIADYNQDYLDVAQQTFSKELDAQTVTTHKIDVSKPIQWSQLQDNISKLYGGPPDFLMLNAGIGAKGSWGDGKYYDEILQTNLMGVVYGLNVFVPAMQEANKEGSTIVITGSKQGITNPPGNAAYNASKAAVKALAEHLSYDLKDTNVGVHLLVPGWTFTGLSGNTPSAGGHQAEKPEGAWWPEQVVEMLYKHIDEGKFWIICPDNDVTSEMDQKRMMWTAGDMVYGRKPLSRWRDEYKEESTKFLNGQ